MPTTVSLPSSFRSHPARRVQGRGLTLPSLAALHRTLLDTVLTLELWQRRHEQRRALRSLPDHLLHDIGHSQADVEAEAAKPFWQA